MMKYMTPELIVRGQSRDPAELDAVETAWEANGERYREYFDQIRPVLPAGLLRLLDSYSLHDARVLAISRPAGGFHVLLQLDTPPRSLVGVHYDLVAEPTITEGVLPAGVATQGDWVEWWYDEIELIPGKPPTWRHSILLSNGWEITLDCRDVRIEESVPVLPRLPVMTPTTAGAV
jgi:hypothetical protein